jgi:antitoxin (DNA-binding transcriptional repressor) of toxin-antitoxin stability system
VYTLGYTPVSIRNLKQIHTATHHGAALEKKPPADIQPTNEEAQQKADLAALEAESGDEEWRYNRAMADHVIHISKAEAASNWADLLARVRAGAEIVIESGQLPVTVIRAPAPPRAPSPSASRPYPRTRLRPWMLTSPRM